MSASAWATAASPSVLSWNSALARRRGRKTSGATISTASAGGELDRPVQQPQPEGDREEGDGDRRQRVEHERREEGDAQRRQAGGPQRLAGPRDAGALLGGAAEGPQDGKALEDVGDVTAEVLDLVPAVAGERQARPSDERPEHREQADRRDDDETRNPVEHADGDREGERSHDREDEIRQAPPDVDVEGVEPASGHRREVSRTACVSKGGSGEGRGDESRSQVGLGRCRTVVGEGLADERGEAADDGGAAQPDEVGEPVPGVGPGQRAGEEVGERDRLDDDGGRGDEPDRDGGGDGAPHDRQLADEVSVGARSGPLGPPAACAEAAGHV